MTTKPPSPIWRPGTDPKTGWPLTPQGPCPKGEKQCHLRLLQGTLDCAYQPEYCPFYGHFPDLRGN